MARRTFFRRIFDLTVRLLMALGTLLTCALLTGITVFIFSQGWEGISWAFLTSAESVLRGTRGIFPALCNTLYVILVSLAIVLTLGVGAAIYLTEYAQNRKLVQVIEFASDILAGIPSIIYALVGLILFCETMRLGKTLLAGSLTLAMMTLPIIIRTTQESLKSVPRSYREGSLALGSGKWRMIRTVVLPASADGILTGCILAAGRIVGESAVLIYTAGLSTMMQDFFSLDGLMNSSGATLTVALYVYAKERADFSAAFSVAAILLLLTAAIDLAAAFTGRKLKHH